MSTFLIITLTLLVYVIYLKLIKPGLYWQKRGVIHVKPWIRFVKVFLSSKSFSEIIQDAYNEYPNLRYYGSYQFMTPSLFLRDLDLIKQMTIKDFDHFPDHYNFVTEKSDPLMGANLFSLKGERWKNMRATLSPAFTSSKMKAMFLLISETADNFVNHFLNENKDLVELEMKEAFSKYTNYVIASCAFGIKCNSLDEENNEFFLMGKEAMKFSGWRAVKNLLNALFPQMFEFFRIPLLPDYVSNFFRRVVKETIATRETNRIVRPDMIYLLMEARKGRLNNDNHHKDAEASFAETKEFTVSHGVTSKLTDNEITAQALVFFFAGFETASTVMSFLSYELALQPEIQLKLQAEIDQVLDKGDVTYEDILKMKYLDQVVSEALRKWPPAFALSRICVKDYMIQPKGGERPQLIQKGCLLLIPVHGIHMDPKYFPSPEKFDPERFSEQNRNKIYPNSYLPFGLGPRNCIGSRFALLEMKTLMFHLLSKFNIVVVEKTVIPVRLSKTFNIGSRDGFWLGLQRRQST